MIQSRLSLLALHFIPGIGDHLIKQLISYCGSAEQVFKTPKGKLLKIPGIGAVSAETILKGKPFQRAENEIREAERQSVDLVFFTDKNYPSRLKTVEDAPTLLYTKGNMNLEAQRTLAIVGTRRATNYGKLCVEDLVSQLIPYEPLIISGLAYGIDIMAHKQAIACNLPTIGIMGSGIDVIYPSIHKDTALRMQTNGGIITENPFGTRPDAHNFPARNRIIAGLSDALVVVEAGKTGGALITAEIANSYHKDVFAFPGNVGQSYSIGCNDLIKMNKAHLISSVRDIDYIMNWSSNKPKQQLPALQLEGCSPQEKKVIETIMANGGTLVIDEISWKTNLSVSQLASILLTLEFKGMIQSLPGKLFRLSHSVSV